MRDFSAPGGVPGPGDGCVSKPEEASLPLKPLHAARLTYMRAALPAPASSGAIRAAEIDPPGGVLAGNQAVSRPSEWTRVPARARADVPVLYPRCLMRQRAVGARPLIFVKPGASDASSKVRETALFVGKQQPRAALLLLVRCGRRTSFLSRGFVREQSRLDCLELALGERALRPSRAIP